MQATLEVKDARKKWTTEAAKPYTDSCIIIIGGPKRNCKSLLMASLIVWKLIEGETVWSNMPVHTSEAMRNHFRYSPSGKLIIKHCETKPLDWNLLYMLDESYVEGTVAIDEIGDKASARTSQSTSNRLINSCMRQVGHRCLDLLGTARSFYRLDRYLRDEVDIYIDVQDLRFSPWGLKNNIEGGRVALLKYYDISGAMTGKSCYNGYTFDTRDYYQEQRFYGTPFWDCYDTKNIMSLEEIFTPVQLDLKKRKISNKDDSEKEGIQEKILAGIASFKKQGKEIIPTHIFWRYLRDTFGVEGDTGRLGRLVPREVKRLNYGGSTEFRYDFSDLNI